MKYLVNFVTHIGSNNLGDYIIMDAIEKILYEVLHGENVYIINISVHQPLSRYHRNLIKTLAKNKTKTIKIISGTNLFHLYYSPFARLNQWKVGLLDIPYVKEVILFGVGTQVVERVPKRSLYAIYYSKTFWSGILSPEFIHAVRDKESVRLLNTLGFNNAINLGCPTLWNLTREHCKKIPKKKSDIVVTSLTSGNKDFKRDLEMLKILLEYYDEVYLWVQDPKDYPYLKELSKKLEKYPRIIPPRLREYDAFLSTNEVDYVGTRLHGGIRALQHKKKNDSYFN